MGGEEKRGGGKWRCKGLWEVMKNFLLRFPQLDVYESGLAVWKLSLKHGQKDSTENSKFFLLHIIGPRFSNFHQNMVAKHYSFLLILITFSCENLSDLRISWTSPTALRYIPLKNRSYLFRKKRIFFVTRQTGIRIRYKLRNLESDFQLQNVWNSVIFCGRLPCR